MITITIDNPELEKIFHENFASNNDSFVDYISNNCHANNLAYSTKYTQEESAYLQAALDECDESDEGDKTIEEVFSELLEKYDKNHISIKRVINTKQNYKG